MTALVFVPLRNTRNQETGKLKSDAHEFRVEAQAFQRAHGRSGEAIHIFDNELPLVARREALLSALEAVEPGALSMLACFTHGWPDGIQLGFSCAHVRGLVRELKPKCGQRLTVALYCCSTGADDDHSEADERVPGPGGDGGFADRLRDELCDAKVRATVFAHSTAGHCTHNPRVRVFEPHVRAGGRWLVEPGGPLWHRWLRALHGGDLRFRFPVLAQSELERELSVP